MQHYMKLSRVNHNQEPGLKRPQRSGDKAVQVGRQLVTVDRVPAQVAPARNEPRRVPAGRVQGNNIGIAADRVLGSTLAESSMISVIKDQTSDEIVGTSPWKIESRHTLENKGKFGSKHSRHCGTTYTKLDPSNRTQGKSSGGHGVNDIGRNSVSEMQANQVLTQSELRRDVYSSIQEIEEMDSQGIIGGI
jgi:hypothetical protein